MFRATRSFRLVTARDDTCGAKTPACYPEIADARQLQIPLRIRGICSKGVAALLACFAVIVAAGESEAGMPGKGRGGSLERWEARLETRYEVTSAHFSSESGTADISFRIAGDFSPPGVAVGRKNLLAMDYREIARAFLQRESDFLGLTNQAEELTEESLKVDRHGRIHIAYSRRVGGWRLESNEINLHLEAGGRLFYVNGRWTELAPGAISRIETTTPRIPQDDAWRIIKDNLEIAGYEPDSVVFLYTEQRARPMEPHVVWVVDVTISVGLGRWSFEIDAVTGAILEKRFTVKDIEIDEITYRSPSKTKHRRWLMRWKWDGPGTTQ